MYIHMNFPSGMPSKTLMIRRPVYEELRRAKRRGESFSKVIERLLSRKHPLGSLLGLWSTGGRSSPRAVSRKRRRPRSSGGSL